ncbi:DEAD/DEAH box helicase [Salmonella enterica]|nr:DEAD/DEAH box helicase [Salmonella enterica]
MPEGVTLFQDTLIKSLKFGFVDNVKFQEGSYSPQILINDPESKRYVLKDIQEELSKCQAFYISVAFITQSGIALIKSQLSDLMDKGINGKILISPYLDFNDPIAMKELLKLKNVEVRLTPKSLQMHAKFYLFEHKGKQVLISGSSNLTHNALKINYEWNIKLTSTHNGELIQATKKEFEKIWDKSDILTLEKIASYAKQRQKTIRVDQIKEDVVAEYLVKTIQPNKMQEEALKGLQAIRDSGKKKALVISATGTGKTYLSAFDVHQFEPKRMLFIVHREQILQKSLKDFQKVLKFPESEALIYHSGADLTGKKYVFATIQTLSRDYHLNLFSEDYFDYILIDEVHKAGADSYKKVMAHFQPEFFLGMTATPERTDGQNIYELFDYNIAYEIRLQDALDNDMLCPFIYFGVKDIEINGQLIDETTNITNLTSDERVKHILQKIDFYGVSGDKVKGLIFCSSKQEAHELALKLNQNGKNCRALTGDDTIETRNEVVAQLERGKLEYILTVDIFNEGIDIPSVNQVVMLRNTQSSIVFVQQLGRGLRKHESKEYVTIIDFIGNYKNNYLIPIALFGEKSMNKDNYRRELREPNILNGLTTINFEEVAKEQIFKSITNTSLSNMKILQEAFIDLENKLGRHPLLVDYLNYNSIDPLVFFENSSFKNYIDVLNKFSKTTIELSEKEVKRLNFLTFEVLPGKRKHELLLLEYLVKNGKISKENFINLLRENHLATDVKTISSVESVLNLTFLKAQELKKFGKEPLVYFNGSEYGLEEEFIHLLNRFEFRQAIEDIIQAGLIKSLSYPAIFTVGQKYSRRDVAKLLNWAKDEPPLNIGGYKIDKETNTCPIFITYHKDDEINDTIKYEDELLNETTLKWFSKNKRTLESPDVQAILHSPTTGLDVKLFIIKDDAEGGDFYYLGNLNLIPSSVEEMVRPLEKGDESIVTMQFKLDHPISDPLYRYITNK